MVGTQVTFGNYDTRTPHGGAPFQGWRKGYGFGHSKGPGHGNVLHPAAAVQLRFTPKGDRGLASNPFWATKWEMAPASSFGVGDRPSLYHNKDVKIGPDHYGDVSKCVALTKPQVVRPGIKLKARYPAVEEASIGPGPGKYDTSRSGKPFDPGFTFGARVMSSVELKEQIAKPGPDYKVRIKPGTNSPIRKGTLYDISMHGKIRRYGVGEASPGPARYNIMGDLDKYGLLGKIQNVPGPPDGYWRADLKPVEEFPKAPGGDHYAEAARGLTRVESAPV